MLVPGMKAGQHSFSYLLRNHCTEMCSRLEPTSLCHCMNKMMSYDSDPKSLINKIKVCCQGVSSTCFTYRLCLLSRPMLYRIANSTKISFMPGSTCRLPASRMGLPPSRPSLFQHPSNTLDMNWVLQELASFLWARISGVCAGARKSLVLCLPFQAKFMFDS